MGERWVTTEADRSRQEERWVLTAAGQRSVDQMACESGIEPVTLMESAGTGAAEWIVRRLALHRVTVIAGPGGNGGDALVVSRHLLEAGVETRTFVLAFPPDRLSPPAGVMLDRLVEAGGDVVEVRGTDFTRLSDALVWGDYAVDGLFGSGLNRPVAGAYEEAVHRMNAAGVRVVSLDLPSGLPSDFGALLGEAVRASVTLAMGYLKPAHLLFPASACCGSVAVVPVAYPAEAMSDVVPWARVLEREGVRRRLPPRRPDGHKGTFGRVLVVAGSIGMTGAAIFCCRGALRAGAGSVTLAAPSSLDPILETALPEVITVPLPDSDGLLADADDPRFTEVMERADVLAIGPGLSRAPETGAAVREIVSRFAGPVVLDADGIAAFRDRLNGFHQVAVRTIATPHAGELGELIGESSGTVDAQRRDIAANFAEQHGCVLVLKGRPTAIALPNGDVYFNPTGNTGLATGGSGDVLTGLIAGLVAGGAPLADAAVLGPYVHGLAAESYARDRAERSLVPTDLVDLLPYALREVEQ
jgi:hydroxyethylthiazole kinase-like uncharacterized protein yjeF